MIEILDGTMETVNYFGDSRVKIYHNYENEAYPLHWHAAIEMTLCLEEDYTYSIQGKDVKLSRGDFIWLPAGALHSIYNPNNTGRRLITLFDPLILNAFTELTPLISFLSPYYVIRANEPKTKTLHSKLQKLASDILTLELEGSQFKNVLIYSKLIEAAAAIGNAIMQDDYKLDRKMDESEETVPQAHLINIYNSCEYIKNHSHEKITLDDLAHRAGFSKYYYSRLFKTFTGMSFIDYLNNSRIEQFEKLIANPDTTITEAAYACGFNSISSFNRVFKKNKGFSPSQYLAFGKNHDEKNQLKHKND